MDWVKRLNEAVDYLEEHLDEEIDYARAAKIACCSAYHFQRMFTYMAGFPLSEYIRRRRMTLAAAELQAGGKIVDVALKYGYESPTAFNRAFQGVHGFAPSLVREAGAVLHACSRIRFHITIQGAEDMEYRLEKKYSACARTLRRIHRSGGDLGGIRRAGDKPFNPGAGEAHRDGLAAFLRI